jgi:hypothetical protein
LQAFGGLSDCHRAWRLEAACAIKKRRVPRGEIRRYPRHAEVREEHLSNRADLREGCPKWISELCRGACDKDHSALELVTEQQVRRYR